MVACRALEKESMKYYINIFALAGFVVGTTLCAQNASTNSNEVVARVSKTAIQRRELDMAVAGVMAQIQRQGRTVTATERQQLERDVLNSLVERELVLQFASANPPADVDQKVKAQVDRARAAAGGEDLLVKSLQDAGVARAEFERRIRENVIVAEALRQVAETQTKVPPEDVKTFYEANAARIKQPELVRASHILVRVDPKADEETKKICRTKINAARSLVLGGENFADIARKVSDDAQNARSGGDLGFFQRGAMVPEFDKVAFSLPTNQVSEVITTQFGYHVMMVTDHKAEKQLSFDEAKDDIERLLRSRKSGDVIRKHVASLRDKAKVEILLPPLPPPATNAPPPAAVAPKS
jgi:peptidyl-prolyl cis-trans isomerase C